jgi:hypothetical protein
MYQETTAVQKIFYDMQIAGGEMGIIGGES